MTDGGPALFRLVRFWSRRWARGPAADADVVPHPQLVLVVEAVHAAGADASVNDVARQLGLDQSGASRMVTVATAEGYLARARAAADARRTALRLTPAGEQLLTAARDWQCATFEQLTARWAASDRERFAGYLQRLADETGA
ncbi:MarR family winged helix-turn-helix transcriptional regulator [Cryptosporangium aurantiacum]|uniref:Transcriptional regulator, MarR family n=1 Tax=Cryptosporangium aurantiacum TaxID=134849 RepID=A0A1M7RE10_9ACTN|nr:MarR family winged helix-turn-helix transcriptional regulator [Cryptosporangium aurantiacum]SHN44412.1 transcriptional regulator, MarR family [Cryptosporangium aurantiacum]